MMPEEFGYQPCSNCADDSSETLEQEQGWLCEDCHNGLNCGCKDCVDIMLFNMSSSPAAQIVHTGGAHHG